MFQKQKENQSARRLEGDAGWFYPLDVEVYLNALGDKKKARVQLLLRQMLQPPRRQDLL